ncbi:hypothetical protein AN216_03940 [Streptomyces oceani]|uniref:Uncharacterized protein n=1 Tax=Streptomyces oceani TaxID=1075402 RepID=A0A1E7KMM8_9ACTN|nr:hypothetical protein AN216_03940 [Streptomyces oceani]
MAAYAVPGTSWTSGTSGDTTAAGETSIPHEVGRSAARSEPHQAPGRSASGGRGGSSGSVSSGGHSGSVSSTGGRGGSRSGGFGSGGLSGTGGDDDLDDGDCAPNDGSSDSYGGCGEQDDCEEYDTGFGSDDAYGDKSGSDDNDLIVVTLVVVGIIGVMGGDHAVGHAEQRLSPPRCAHSVSLLFPSTPDRRTTIGSEAPTSARREGQKWNGAPCSGSPPPPGRRES